MYEILHFRLALYLLVGLGFAGFTIATASPFMFVVSVGFLLVNVTLIRTGRFRPLPRWVANTLTLGVAGYTALTIYSDPRPIFPIGNFLVALQVIKLFEQRANRDYAQLLVLSLLLMVAAAISTAGLGFGITFIVYLLLSPYACLLFHLKVEADHAKRLIGLDERQPDPITLRQDQRFLNRSLTRVIVVVATISLGMAVLVFLFFPRVPGSNLLAFQFRPPGAGMTGLSDEMSMNSVTNVQQNTAQVAALTITHNGTLVTGGEIYLRGSVFDIYDGDPKGDHRWSWGRTSATFDQPPAQPRTPNEPSSLDSNQSAEDGDDVWVQEFKPLKPINVPFLPAMSGVAQITVSRPLKVGYNAVDGVINVEPLNYPLNYRVTSTNVQLEALPRFNRRLIPFPSFRIRDAAAHVIGATLDAGDPSTDESSGDDPSTIQEVPGGRSVQRDTRDRSAWPTRSIIAPQIATYARRPEVSGLDDTGKPLVDRLTTAGSRPGGFGFVPPVATEQVARNIERHLQTQFTYTLNLGDAQRSRDDTSTVDEDPVVRFLYTTRSGWCEHFAYAMTLMCQSLGMQARIVSGYKVDEFNTLGNYFIVRQSHAHAWVEVLVRDGDRNVWRTFDPTGSRDAANAGNNDSTWTRVTHVFDYLEHIWANSVVAYDSTAQSGLLDRVEGQLVASSDSANNVLRDSSRKFNDWKTKLTETRYDISVAIIVTLIATMTLVALVVTSWYLVVRFRLTRRARRIGLAALRKPEARRLARQLGFYDELVRELERRDIVRPAHLTPLEFGQSLSFLPREAYDAVVRLTRIFYRVRYGDAVLTPARQRALDRVVERLRDVVNPRPSSRAHSELH